MNQLHFTINLNKHGELRQQEEQEKKIFFNFTLAFVIGTVLLYSIALYFNHTLTRKFDSRLTFLRSLEAEIRQYQTSGEYLSSRDLERLAAASTDRVFWARKLVALSEDVSEQIAVTHFSFKNGILSLYGITKVDIDEREFDLIDDFINTLRENDDISIDFPEIRFVRSTRDRVQEADIIRFQVDAIGRGVGRRGGRR